MANEAHLAQLKEGMTAWNQWRKEHYPVLRQRCALAFQRVWGMAAPAGRQGLQTLKETGRKTFDRLRATPWQAIASQHWKLFLVIVAVIAVGIIWKVPQWQAAGWQGQMEPKDLAKLQNDARTTLVQALGGAVLLIGLYFTLRNLQLTQDRQITEHYTRAVEHLGSDKLAVRLGAIYALERIARDSERDHWPIMEILTAYVREQAPWVPREGDPWEDQDLQDEIAQSSPLAIEIQAILTVLGRRTRTYGKGEDRRLNLSYTDLHEVDLHGANLVGADLSCANLLGADFKEADLREVDFFDSVLRTPYWSGAQLQEANLRGVDVRMAWQLTVEQLSTVETLLDAELDPPLREQIQQQYPHLLEEP